MVTEKEAENTHFAVSKRGSVEEGRIKSENGIGRQRGPLKERLWGTRQDATIDKGVLAARTPLGMTVL
jgi:hypothetical protein